MDSFSRGRWPGRVLVGLFMSGTLLAQPLPAGQGLALPRELPPPGAGEALLKGPPEPGLPALPEQPELPAQPEPAARPERLAAAVAHGPPSSAVAASRGGSVELLAPQPLPSEPAGIPGGSLTWQSHGLQWSFLRARPGQPRARVALSGLAWVDSSYRSLLAGGSGVELGEWQQQTRAVLRATPTYSAPEDWFVQGQAELVVRAGSAPVTDGGLVLDDVYLRVGKWHAFDLSAGRFQGWEVYHLGMGLEPHTSERSGASTAQNPALDVGTDLQFLWARRAGPGSLALHVYPLSFLRFELLSSFGTGAARGSAAERRTLGVRLASILDFGVLKAKVAADYLHESPREPEPAREARTVRRGVVGALQGVLAPLLELGVAGGYALVDEHDASGMLDPARSNTTYGFAAFASVRAAEGLVLGAGGAYTHRRNLQLDSSGTVNDIESHSQLFGALQYTLWQQLHVKAVFARASALFDPRSDPLPATFRNRALSGRLRLLYEF